MKPQLKFSGYIIFILLGKYPSSELTLCEKPARGGRSSFEQIGDFCTPNPVQNFHSVIRCDHNPVDLSKYLIHSSLYTKKL